MLTIHAVCADRETKKIVRKAVEGYKTVIELKELDYEPQG